MDIKKKITIAIPTFNRSIRLEKSLKDLLGLIKKSDLSKIISIYISNNGSTDNTDEILKKFNDIYEEIGISFSFNTFKENVGFDLNVLNCYNNCRTDYIWFLSDDDNIIEGAINSIMIDIEKFSPNVLFYNFDQFPNNQNNPLIINDQFHVSIEAKNPDAISKMLLSPKLTSIVLKICDSEIGVIANNYKFNYMHIALAVQTMLKYGNVYYSKLFVAYPDDNFLDQIDFVPFIINDLEKTVFEVLSNSNRLDIYENINFVRIDPLISSFNNLALFFRGKYVLTPKVKSELFSVIKFELINIRKWKNRDSIQVLLSIMRFVRGFVYNRYFFFFNGIKLELLRSSNLKN